VITPEQSRDSVKIVDAEKKSAKTEKRCAREVETDFRRLARSRGARRGETDYAEVRKLADLGCSWSLRKGIDEIGSVMTPWPGHINLAIAPALGPTGILPGGGQAPELGESRRA
jgi:hypothetical protein